MSLQDQVVVPLFSASASAIVTGNIVRASGTRSVVLAQANNQAGVRGVLGVSGSSRVGQGGAVNVVTTGAARVRLETGLTPLVGDTLWVSAATAGLGTNVEPGISMPIGVITDTTGYSASNPYVAASVARVSEASGGSAADLLFPTVADMAAFDMTGQPNGTVAEVVTLRRKFTYSATSTVADDPINFDAVTATGGGRWLDSGEAHNSWQYENVTGTTAFWVIDPIAGDNENIGSAAAPIQTAKELDKRLHSLRIGVWDTLDITIENSLPDSDAIVLNGLTHATATQFGQVNIRAARTIAASGTVSGVTNQAPATNTFSSVTLSANIDAHVGKYIRFFNGATFRCSAWVVKALGGNTYILSTPNDENGDLMPLGTSIINPLIGNNFEVYDLKTIPDLIVTCPQWEIISQVFSVRIVPAAGAFGFNRNFVDDMLIRYTACDISGAMYGTDKNHQVFSNSKVAAFGFAYGLQQGTYFMSAGLVVKSATGFTDDIVAPRIEGGGGPPLSEIAFHLYPTFQDVTLNLSNTVVTRVTTGTDGIAFLDVVSTQALIHLSENVNAFFDTIWGTGNSGAAAGINFSDRGFNNFLFFNITPIVDAPAASEIRMRDAAVPGNAINCSFADTALNNLVDERGNEIIGRGGRTVAVAVAAINAAGATVPAGDIVRTTTSAGNFTRAQADTAANAAGVAGVALNTSAVGARALIAAAGHPRANYDGAPSTGGLAYLSPGTAGKLTTTIPAAAATNQKLRMGRVGAITGTTARTAWSPENLPVTADGSP